ncbi:MAG: hypothetical protein ACYTEQ_19150, partial [Planctomycetota bacterium]
MGPGAGDDALIGTAEPGIGPVIDVNVTCNMLGGPARGGGEQQMLILAGDVVFDNWSLRDAGDRSTVSISGDSVVQLDSGEARVADNGTVVLDISQDAAVTIGGRLRAGDEEGVFELYIADNASLSIGQNFNIGDDGDGIVEISGGLLEVGENVSFE